ncbi:MAG: glycosyltransferase [bacterium]|nr:glycosyltransferase [bacterium]
MATADPFGSAPWRSLDALDSPQRRANFAYLPSFAPDVWARMQDRPNDEALAVQIFAQFLRCRRTDDQTWVFGEDPAREMNELKSKWSRVPPEADFVIVAGTRAGYSAQAAVQWLQRFPRGRVLLIECSVARMTLCAGNADLRDALASGRLHLALAPPEPGSVLDAIRACNPRGAKQAYWVCDSKFDGVFSGDTFNAAYGELIDDLAHERIRVIDSLNARPRANETIERVLLFDCWSQQPQHVHIQAAQTALQSRGVETRVFTLDGFRFDLHAREYRRLLEPRLLALLNEFQPQLALSYAYHAPHLFERDAFEAFNAPFIQIVSNIAHFDRTYFNGERAAVIDRGLIGLYRKRGVNDVFFLPIMADYAAERPAQSDGSMPIVFVGNSLGLNPREREALRREWARRPGLLEQIDEAEALLSSFDSGRNLYDVMESARFPSLDSPEEEYAVFRYLLCESTAARRVRLLESIAPLKPHVFGNWEHSVTPDSPLRSCLQGPWPIQRERELFERGKIFINIHSTGHVTGPNMRFFNVCGMGGFQLSDGAFDEFLTPGVEWARFESEADLTESIRYYLANPAEVDSIREAGWWRTHSEWTYVRWVRWIEAETGFHFGHQS